MDHEATGASGNYHRDLERLPSGLTRLRRNGLSKMLKGLVQTTIAIPNSFYVSRWLGEGRQANLISICPCRIRSMERCGYLYGKCFHASEYRKLSKIHDACCSTEFPARQWR